MGYLFFIVICLVGVVAYHKFAKDNLPKKVAQLMSPAVYLALGGVLIFSVWQTSVVMVDKDETGHFVRKYLGTSMPTGNIIAMEGENGPQAAILGPGFHFLPLIRIWGEVDVLPIITIPPGLFGEITTTDGRNLPEDAVIAPPWPGYSLAKGAPPGDDINMLDAAQFLKEGGYKGLQSAILKPGNHRLNLYLFRVRVSNGTKEKICDRNGCNQYDDAHTPTVVTDIPTGAVGVVKSNLNEGWNDAACRTQTEEVTQGQLRAVLVPSGCKGVWKDTFEPGAYFFNPSLYQVTIVETRAQRWTYKGGYTRCTIDLTIDQQGQLTQQRDCVVREHNPDSHVDEAIFVKVEGWDIPIELRALVQVTPEQAAAVVASVGSLVEVENRIVTPAIRSVVRNIGGGFLLAPVPGEFEENGDPVVKRRATRALDFAEYRDYLEEAYEVAIKREGKKAGIRILEVKLGEPAIPPELLVARRRNQLAQQLAEAYIEERQAQNERVKTEKSRALADQQPKLVEQDIATQRSVLYMEEQKNRGNADKQYLAALASGQKAQSDVLGPDRVMALQALEKVLATLEAQPQILSGITLPRTVVFGQGGLEGPAAMLAGSNLFEKSSK